MYFLRSNVSIFYFIIFLSSLINAIDIQTIFLSHINNQSNATVRFNAVIPFNISYGSVIVTNGSYVCTGSQLGLTANNITTFSPISVVVECPRECSTYSSPSSSFPQSILWISENAYNANKSQYNITSSWCNYSKFPQPPHPLAQYNYTSIYKSVINQSSGIASLGVFCYGNISFYENNNQISSPFTVSSTGLTYLSARLITGECSLLARSFETSGPTLDCWYSNQMLNNYAFENSTQINVISGPNLTLTPTKTDYSVTPGGTVTFKFKLNNSGDMNATISGVTVSDGFSVDSFSPSTINAGEVVDFTVSATAPILQAGTTVTPTISFDFNSTVPIIGTCGAASVANVNVGNVLIGDINPISVRIYATPSGFFNEGNTFLPSKLNITARIWREDPHNQYLNDIVTNISIYYYNTTLKNWRLKFNVTGISGSTDSPTVNERNIAWWSNSDGIFINLNETISSSSPFSYVPGVYKVEIRSYDDAATRGSKIQTDSRYFVIFTLPGCARKV
ncbi:MAG: hypothetical protein QW771_00615 [Candidatus Micrarchaeia archaeon]